MTLTIAGTVDEALEALAGGARPIAGGTDLVVGVRQGKAPLPGDLVAVDRIEELQRIEVTDEATAIGSGVTHARLMSDPAVAGPYTALADGAALVGSPATRNVGTLGGNVMNGSPAMDTGAPLLVFDAVVELRSTTGHRRVSLGELWTGPGQTSAAADELCVALHVPSRPDRSGSAYVRLEYRRAMEIAVVGAAASVVLTDDGTVADVRVTLAAVAPTIIEVRLGDDAIGGTLGAAAAAASTAAAEQAAPISDLRASERYRRHTVGVMAGRAVHAAGARAAGESIAIPVNRALGVGAAR